LLATTLCLFFIDHITIDYEKGVKSRVLSPVLLAAILISQLFQSRPWKVSSFVSQDVASKIRHRLKRPHLYLPKQRNYAFAAAAASAVQESDKSSKGPVLMAYRDRFDTDQVKISLVWAVSAAVKIALVQRSS
jgi:hypothetical protein